jgi:cell pole-organizing protein PopZ
MTDEPDNSGGEPVEPQTLEEAREQLRVLRKELASVRKESARRRQALKERDGEQADAGTWRTVALEAVVQAEAAAAGARRPELLARLVDVGEVEGDTLADLRASVREQVGRALDDAPELLGEPPAVGVRSPGVQNRQQRRERPASMDAWLRKAARH